MTNQAGKWFTIREPDKCWTQQGDIQHQRDRTEKAHRGVLVWSIYEALGDWTGTGDQPSGKVVLERGAGRVKETTRTESGQS